MTRLISKLNARDRVHLVIIAYETGLVARPMTNPRHPDHIKQVPTSAEKPVDEQPGTLHHPDPASATGERSAAQAISIAGPPG